MAKKTKFTRVAVAGLTASDGRTIEPQHLTQMAASYNPDTYTARVNVEHIRNLSADGPFPALGDVIALRTQTDEIEVAGKTEKRLALYAQIAGNEKLQAYIAADQKKFTSIEIEPNFNGTGAAYLMGLAATDSPASLGTQALQFAHAAADDDARALKAHLDSRKSHASCFFSAAHATTIEFEAETPSAPAGDTALDRFFARMETLFGKKAPPSDPDPAAAPSPDQAADLQALFSTFASELRTGLAETLAQDRQAASAAVARVTSEFAALKAQLEDAPASGFNRRPPATGGDGAQLADC